MEENVKLKIVSNDLVRRLCNSMEDMGVEERMRVVDGYSQKLINSGYSIDQTRGIVVNGIKGYEGRRRRCSLEGRKLWRKAAESEGARIQKKLLSKKSWYKGDRKKADYYDRLGSRSSNGGMKKGSNKPLEQKSVLFVENTNEGELAKRIREVILRLAPVLGFSIKVVERTGATLQSKFPQAALWEGAHCGRDVCITCNQGAETLVPCTRKSLVYENICEKCNPGAGGKEEVTGSNPDHASIYVGETSRTIQERGREHWAAARGSSKAKEGSHIAKHQEQMHKGEDPLFILRAVSFHKTALSRQTGEAVRIRRRGGEGAVLNSKAEFNRCYIPRLRVVGEEELTEVREQEERDLLLVGERLGAGDVAWERNKRSKRAEPSKGSLTSNAGGAKRLSKDHGGGARPSKRRKFALLEGNWGFETTLKTTPTEAKTIPEEAKTTLVEDSQEPGSQEYQEVATGSQSTNQTGHPGAASGSRRLVDQECLTGQHGVGTSGAVHCTTH